MSPAALGEAVSSFLSAVSDELAALSGKPAAGFLADVANEVSNIVGGVMAADDRCTDGELDAYLDVVGPLLDPPLITSTVAARSMNLFRGKPQALQQPSVLFDLLCRADEQYGSRRSHVYYELGLRLAHVSAALDLVPSVAELTLIDTFRSCMLRRLDAGGVPRPGQPAPAPPAAPGPGTPMPAGGAMAPH
ncbi:MAG: hypothetical protein Q7V88_19590, partial [Actinomycetota bacterium]|nr:hypothetical protein [Actinomycetota bacterium]